ncbi:MAG: TauD/TfdA family dioxygenase [Crocosphaera sp.]
MVFTLEKGTDTKSNSPSLSLPDSNSRQWQQEALSINVPRNVDPYLFLLPLAKELAKKYLPEDMKETIGQINQPGGLTHFVLTGFPQDPQLPPTPSDGQRPATKQTWVSEIVLLGIIPSLGAEPFSYLEEKLGDLIHQVAPIKGLEDSQSNAGSNRFKWHADNASLLRQCVPEGIALSCLRNQGETATLYAPIDEIIAAMHPRDVEVLRQPRFRVGTPESFHLFGGKLIYSEPRPIIREGLAGAEIALATYNVLPVNAQDEEAQMALWGLKSALRPPVALSVVLQPGQIFAFSNVRGLHSRGPITGDRWLQRCYFRQDLRDMRRLSSKSETCRVFSSEQLFLL